MMPHLARICLALAAGLVAGGATAAPAASADDASATGVAASEPSRSIEQEVRRKVSAGEIRFGDCIRDSVVSSGETPKIVFRNTCDTRISIELCARRPQDVEQNHFFFVVDGQTESPFRLWFKTGQRFNYTYNTCGVLFCTPPDSDC